ncbi:MAG TPA: hypothetical protein DC000_06685 [Clostridiales bacterium]|nr:hypothetical protein [Clostridiales bacterium]
MKTRDSVRNRIINIEYEKNKISWVYYMPLLFIVGFVPLIVYGKYIDLTGTTQALFWTGQNQLLDFFSYWKSRWVICLTAIALMTYIFLFISKKLPFKKEYKYYIPLGIYALFVILSTIFAIDVPTALNGFVDMYQGMWVLLSYVTITFLVINFVNSERDIKLFLYAFIFIIIVEGLIGVGQYFGFDIFNTKFGNSLIIPSGVNVDGGLTFNFGKHTIYGTLFNTNYVGSFASLMLPMAVVFLITAKTTKKRIIAGIALLLCLFTWIGCNSRAGYIGVAFALLVALVILRRYILKYWKISVTVLLAGIIGAIGFNFVSDGMLIGKLSSMNVFKAIENIRDQNNRNDVFKFESIELGKDTVSIKTTFQDLNIKIDGDKLFFVDDNDEIIPMKKNDNGYLEPDIKRTGYFLVNMADSYPGFNVYVPWISNNSLNFYVTESGIKFINSGGRVVDIIEAKNVDFLNGLEKFASGRGYIWGRTIPLIKNSFVIGEGPDNYIYAFPQDDLIGKLKSGLYGAVVVDKPHNMFLQIVINTGFISLVFLLILWLIYIYISLKLYWKIELNSLDKYMGLACFLSIIGYLAAGMFNDYIVSVSPIFWIILGLGISLNIRLKKE